MARRTKRRVKQRSKAHKKWVKAKRKRKKGAHPSRRVGYGQKKRRAKKANKK